jgi:biopolymer transport protein ExbD
MSRRSSRRSTAPSGDLITRINVTPIIDVALVLVIILLVTAPMLSTADLKVDLPQARTREAEGERNVSITLGPHGEIAVDRDVISPVMLGNVLRDKLAEPGNAGVLVVVRADSGAPHAAVQELLTQARAAGATRLAVATRQSARGSR